MTSTPLMHSEYFLLIQDKGGIKRKLFTTEVAARKSAGLRPSYWYAPRMKVQGGDLWHLVDGKPWVLIESIPGDYNAKTRGLYS